MLRKLKQKQSQIQSSEIERALKLGQKKSKKSEISNSADFPLNSTARYFFLFD